jgi:hypothetical protein
MKPIWMRAKAAFAEPDMRPLLLGAGSLLIVFQLAGPALGYQGPRSSESALGDNIGSGDKLKW